MSLATRVESWHQKHSAAGDFVLIDASDADQKLIFTLGGHVVKVSLPRSSDAIYEVESDADDLMDWLSSISSYVLDHAGELNLETFLDKSVTLYNKSKSKKSDSAVASDDENWDDEEMAEQKGDGDEDQDMNEEGWGDFNEEGDDGVSDESEWSKWHAMKKRWAAKEEKLRKEAANAKVDDEKQQKQIFSSKAATKIITNKLVQLMTEGSKTGLYVEPVDDNIFQWRLRLSQFPSESQLYKDLMKLKVKYGFDYVELEMKFLMDLYPFYPPSVRLVRPRLQNFMMGRIVCMEELQLAKWNPVREISDIIDSIRRLLTQFGSVDDTDDVNDPKKDTPPYTALEFQLLRLSMLTEIAPRIVKTMSDVDQKQLIVPKLDPKKMNSTETEPGTFTKNKKNKSNPGNQQNYWASGTGYGHGSGGAEWDHEAYFAAQRKKDLEILAICEEMLAELRHETVPTGLPLVLEQSCMIPFLETYLKNDSITDMEKNHAELYEVIFNICQEMAKHPSIAKLFLLLPGEKRSLHSYIQDLQKQAAIVEKFAAPTSATSSTSSSTSASTSTSSSSSSSSSTSAAKPKPKTSSSIFKKKSTLTSTDPTQTLSSRILLMAAAVNTAVQKILDEQSAAAALLSSSNHTDEKMSDEKMDVSRYIELMEPYKFGEVEKFVHHHYWGQYQSTEAISRAWTRRLGMEYSDLSKSLPLTPDSSVFLRYHESKMAFCQVLIIAPDGTPYGRGAFLFDVYFPATYPDTPPLVNLQTTGHGSVRFNPNLYNCGKVCLSLLGTWQGSAGESWNAKTSTFLQVAVSIQSLIFVPQPYFNEPGYESSMNTANGKAASDAYNDNIRIQTIKYAMIEMMQKPPPGFEEVIRTHFYLQKDAIMKQCTEWGNTNSGVKALLSSLKTELEKQTLPTSKGS